MYNLFLDDIRIPFSTQKGVQTAFAVTLDKIYQREEWVIVRNYYQFIDTVETKGLPKMVSFDNDLGLTYEIESIPLRFQNISNVTSEEKTGYDALKWLCEYCLNNNKELPVVKIHSANNVGIQNMRDYVTSFNKITSSSQ